MYEKYFKDREKYIDEYKKYEDKYIKGMKALYESAMSGIVGYIDDHISALEKQKSAAIDALKAQQDAAIDALEEQKKALKEQEKAIDKQISIKQDQIDAINEEAEAKQRAYDLDKAQYELDRLKNQRTIYEYSGKEKGFIYKTDDKAIRDQQQEVEDIEREIRISNIEKEIDLLEKRKDALEEQQDAIDDKINEMNEYYESLISNTEAYWDNIIKGFEETKTRWEELQELQEKAELAVTLEQLGIDINSVLSMTDDQFAAFKNAYLANLAEIHSGNDEMIASLSELSGVDLSALPGYLEETQTYINMLGEGIDFSNLDESLGGVITHLSGVAEAAGIATGAIGGGGFTPSTEGVAGSSSEGGGQKQEPGSGSLNQSFKTLGEEAVPNVEKVSSSLSGGEGEEGEGQNLESSAHAARDAIGSGSSGEKGKGKEGESESVQDSIEGLTETTLDEEVGIPAQITKWTELNEVLESVLNNLKEIASEIKNMPTPKSGEGGEAFAAGTDPGFKIGNAYAKGAYGLSHTEKNALRSEYGQPELTVYPNGTTELTTAPTMSDLPKGTVIYNEEQTRAIMKGSAHSTGTDPDMSMFIPYCGNPDEMKLFDDVKKYFGDILKNDPGALLSSVSSGINDISKELQHINEITTHNTRREINVTIGDINLHEVQNADGLSREIVRTLPTLVKQKMSIYK